MTTSSLAPVNKDEKAFPKITGTPGNDTAARRSPIPPPYRAGTGREPGTWLADRIANQRRRARPQTCPKCGTPTLVGDDDDDAPATARVDPEPVDLLHEVAARLTKRWSYALIRGALHFREPEHIQSTHQPHPVLLTHRCTKETLW